MEKEKKYRKNGKKGNKNRSKKGGKRGGAPRDSEQVTGGNGLPPSKSVRCENDISWYTRYQSLIGPNASIIFNTRYGQKQATVLNPSTAISQFKKGVTSTPGVVYLEYMPMYADSANDSSAINVASKNLYTYVRHANSGAANYESSDLMQYLVTVMNLYVHIEQVKRALRIANEYLAENKYVGKNTLAGMYSPTFANDIIINNATYVGYLNTVIAKVNSFKIPKDIAILDRHLWLSSNVFKDDDLRKYTQFVAYTPVLAHYDWANRKVELRTASPSTLGAYITAINTEVDNLLAYEDIGIMIGDILKAYKSEGCRVCSPMQLGEIIDPVVSDELKSELRNMTVMYKQPGTNEYDIVQATGNSQIIYAQQNAGSPRTDGSMEFGISYTGTTYASQTADYNPTITIDADTPSVDQVIIATRFSLCGKIDLGNKKMVVTDYPSEILTACHIAFYMNTTALAGEETILSQYDFHTLEIIGHNPTDSNLFDVVNAINAMHKVSGSAPYSVIQDAGTSGSPEFRFTNYYNGKNVQVVGSTWLQRLHEGCKLSLWTMPMFKLLETQ